MELAARTHPSPLAIKLFMWKFRAGSSFSGGRGLLPHPLRSARLQQTTHSSRRRAVEQIGQSTASNEWIADRARCRRRFNLQLRVIGRLWRLNHLNHKLRVNFISVQCFT